MANLEVSKGMVISTSLPVWVASRHRTDYALAHSKSSDSLFLSCIWQMYCICFRVYLFDLVYIESRLLNSLDVYNVNFYKLCTLFGTCFIMILVHIRYVVPFRHD